MDKLVFNTLLGLPIQEARKLAKAHGYILLVSLINGSDTGIDVPGSKPGRLIVELENDKVSSVIKA